MQRLETRLRHGGLKGDHWKAAARELQALRDEDPDCANAHVLERRALLRKDAEAAACRPDGRRLRPEKGAPHRPVVRTQWFENHMLTDGLKDGAEKGEVRVRKSVELPVNLTLLIGGLSRVKGLSDEQKAAAAMFRGLWDSAQIGGARAIDYSQPAVDVSGKATNPADRGIDARHRYAVAVQVLGLFRSSLIENVVCHEMSVRDLARRLGEGQGGAGQERTKSAVLDAVDQLVDVFGLVPKPGKPRIRAQGERADIDWAAILAAEAVDDSGRQG